MSNVAIAGFDSPARVRGGDAQRRTRSTPARPRRTFPRDAKLTTPYFSDNYWKHPENPAINVFEPGVEFGVPFRPTPFRVTFHVKAGEVEVTREVPVEFRYVQDIYNGDKRMELSVVPAFSVQMTPPLAVIPESAKSVQREIHVAVTNGTKGAAQATVALELPAGWKATPASAPLEFAHEDESLSARFEITRSGAA